MTELTTSSDNAAKQRVVEATVRGRAAQASGQARALLGVWDAEDKVRFLDTLRLDVRFRADVMELLSKE